MRMFGLSFLALGAALIACSSSSPGTSSSSGGVPGDDGGSGSGSGGSSGGATVTEHGIVYDYGTLLASGNLLPVKGLTVTDGDQSTTTDAQGGFSLTMPAGVTLAPVVTGTSRGDTYSYLFFPAGTPVASDVDWGNIITPDQSTFQLERLSLTSDDTKAIVHVVAIATGSCTGLAGGTLTVTSPPGAQVMYFDAQGYPSTMQAAFVEPPVDRRPVADIYDVAPGADIAFTVSHPSCTMAPFPITVGGATFGGQVTTKAAEPGDENSALVIVLQ
jgi:hypothetical protein